MTDRIAAPPDILRIADPMAALQIAALKARIGAIETANDRLMNRTFGMEATVRKMRTAVVALVIAVGAQVIAVVVRILWH